MCLVMDGRRYGPVETNGESAVNCLVDVVREAAAGKQVKMDHWATRYPTNVIDVARVLRDLAGKRPPSSACSLSAPKPIR